MITARVSECSNSVYKWMVIFDDAPSSDALYELSLHLKQLIKQDIVAYMDSWVGLGYITAFFEDLDDVMMAKLRFCGT